jgi:hypothetical protein
MIGKGPTNLRPIQNYHGGLWRSILEADKADVLSHCKTFTSCCPKTNVSFYGHPTRFLARFHESKMALTTPFDVLVEKMRILLSNAQNQFCFDHKPL